MEEGYQPNVLEEFLPHLDELLHADAVLYSCSRLCV